MRPLSWTQDVELDVAANADLIKSLVKVLPLMRAVLVETDRIGTAAAAISSQVIQPAIRARAFPQSMTANTLELLSQMVQITELTRIWRRDVSEAFNDARFFNLDASIDDWLLLIRDLVIQDKERMPELLSRLSTPAVAGMMFGVGASSTRLEADRKAQLYLRRVALVLLSSDDDACVENLDMILDKLIELMAATPASSPSCVTRAEIFMVLRAIVLKCSPIHLAPVWPILHDELFAALTAVGEIASRDTYSIVSILHAAKLLDTLLIVSPDDFQVREWLYITDATAPAVQPSFALADRLAESLNLQAPDPDEERGLDIDGTRPLIRRVKTKDVPRENLLDLIIRPFLQHLSVAMSESIYQMDSNDRSICLAELRDDLFDEV